MKMTMSEMMQKMSEAGMNGGSKLHLRSEELQKKKTIPRIPRLKNALKKKCLILLESELAFPFNPETGEPDDVYNLSNKYRPPFSATTVALAMKDAANGNEALKNTLMKKAGLTEWDTSDIKTFTEQDWEVFVHYRVPRIFSISAIHIDVPAMGTGKYGRDYAITVQRDEELNVIGELPLCLKANKFFRDRAYEEISSYMEKIKSGEIQDTDKQQSEFKAKVYGRVPVSDDRPLNFVMMYEIPLTNRGLLSDEAVAGDLTAADLKEHEVLSRYKKGIRLAVESYMEGQWWKYDKNFDFFEIEMTCPASGDDSTDRGKAQIGQDTKFEKPTVGLKSRDDYGNPDGSFKTDHLIATIREAIDADIEIEQRVRHSMGVSMFTEEVENQLLSSVRSVIDLDTDEFITNRVIKSNTEFISLAFGDEGDEIVEEALAGVTDKSEGRLDEGKSGSESKKYDLSEMAGDDEESLEFEEIDLSLEND